jgi:alkaline phosphatase
VAKYVDGYVIPVKTAKLKQYKKFATLGRKVWLEYGALDYYECVGDDLQAKWGLSFEKLCKLKPGETVVFAFIVYKSKADRKRINALVHKDPRMHPSGDEKVEMPFDMKRFAMGGFKAMVET